MKNSEIQTAFKAFWQFFACLSVVQLLSLELVLAVDYDEFVPKSVVSLIVSSEDKNHLTRTLEKLVRLTRGKQVKVGSVYILGIDTIGSAASDVEAIHKRLEEAQRRGQNSQAWDLANEAQLGPYYLHLKEAGVPYYEFELSERVFKELRVENSPTWIIRHLGRDYVYEGYPDIANLFDGNGMFIAGDE